VFQIELQKVLRMHDAVIQKANASIAAYYNRYNVESRYIRKRFGEGVLGGEVSFTSSPPNGTTFRLKVPRA